MFHKKSSIILLLALIGAIALVMLVSAQSPAVVTAQSEGCATCHADAATRMSSGKHATLPGGCETCHEGGAAHEANPADVMLYPRVHFDMEMCKDCHIDQYNSFMIAQGGRTIYGGSDEHDPSDPNDPPAPKGWSKTSDLPYWNVLIDGHPFVLETYEDRPMSVNQIEHQETIRPGSESCMACHGTKLAYYQGIVYRDAAGQIKADQMVEVSPGVYEPRDVLVKGGTYLPPATSDPLYPQGGTWGNSPTTPGTGHIIYDGTSYKAPQTSPIPGTPGVWEEAVAVTFIPNGTTVATYIDALDPDFPYQVKTLVVLPEPVTVSVPNTADRGISLGTVTFQTLASYPEAGADINGVTGCNLANPGCQLTAGAANLARIWIYAAMEAMAFDGLDYQFDPLHENPATRDILASGYYETHFTGTGANWPSIESGELCNQCHDPMSAKPRIIKKSLIEAIAVRGINPYSPTGSQIYDFNQASRQDQIIAQCGQCHAEYVGGYSANTGRDGDYFPWAKPADLETLYWSLFDYTQDWTHGGPIPPWQSSEANARGFTPYNQRYPINAKLVKVQHPEAEEFFNSPMYNAGATCTDCHSARVTRPDGTRYTSHWFTSPLKIMDGYSGNVHITGDPITLVPANPCAKCHTTDTIPQSKQRIRSQQDNFFVIQERTQVALVNALKFISEQPAGAARDANVTTYQRASMRWEYYTQAENSMGFHNNPEAVNEVANARIWVDAFIPWPLTPVSARITSVGADTMTIAFYDQANNEIGFIVERATALEGPYTQVADIPTPNGANMGDVEWTDAGLASQTTYFYRVGAYNASGTSIYSVWAKGTTQGVAITPPSDLVATPTGSVSIALTWLDNSSNETGFRIERARDANFSVELTVFNVGAGITAFNDSGLTPATTYFYRVFALTDTGVSSPTTTASATTLSAPPAAPSNLVVRSVAKTSITLNWRDNSDNESGFYVERSDDGGKTWARIAALGPNSATFTNTGLARRRTYMYRVQAYHVTNGVSGYSNVVSAKTK